MSLIARCCVCDDKLPNQYSGGPACGGVRCARFEMPRVLNEPVPYTPISFDTDPETGNDRVAA